MVTSRALQGISRALIQAASEEHVVSTVVADLKRIEEALRLQPGLLMDLSESVISLEKRQTALREAWQLSVHPYALNALLTLQEQECIRDLPAFLQMVITDAREIAKHYEVTVRSVVPLRKQDRALLEQALQKRFGGTQHIHEKIDTSILGGLLLEIEHWQLDISLKGTIERLNHCLIT